MFLTPIGAIVGVSAALRNDQKRLPLFLMCTMLGGLGDIALAISAHAETADLTLATAAGSFKTVTAPKYTLPVQKLAPSLQNRLPANFKFDRDDANAR